jgi:hypothetical protein
MFHGWRSYEVDISLYKGHGGGDEVLAKNFVEVIQGKSASASTLEDGLISALMCLKATQSSETNTFREIEWKE